MKEDKRSNTAASVRQRLLNYARRHGDEFQRILDRYGSERFLFRLSRSTHVERVILKGAMLFLKWAGEFYRPTKDIDFLALGAGNLEETERIVREVCLIPCEEDGLEFLTETVRAELIREEQEYGGTRVTFQALLGSARIHLRLDFGYGDAVIPEPAVEEYPTLLDMPAPKLLMYPIEAVVAEKFQALADLGMTNSRMKDFYDLWVLAGDYTFDGQQLSDALKATFQRRKMPIPANDPVALTEEFSGDGIKLTQWRAFLRRGPFKVREDDLGKVIQALRQFLMPPSRALSAGEEFRGAWPPGGPWRGIDQNKAC